MKKKMITKEDIKHAYHTALCLNDGEYKDMSVIERMDLYFNEEGIKLSDKDRFNISEFVNK